MTAQRDEDREKIVSAYRSGAQVLADKFDSIGVRVADIDRTLGFCQQERPNILELGCGNGRDAQELYRRAGSYLGLDISPDLVELARMKVPNARFEVADVMEYSFPLELDAVFAFASLIHLDQEEMEDVLIRIAAALKLGGVLMLSMKYGEYRRVVKEDDFGTRIFHLYTPELIENLASSNFETIWTSQKNLRGQDWFEIILRKTNSV